ALRYDGTGPSRQQVVFTFDLTSADGLFAARQFPVHPRDTVFATEAVVTSARTVLSLIGSVVGVSNAVTNLSN
ncbi:polysaccharide biosynthesis protein, partial [Pseudomonas fluorescens]